MKLDPDTYSGNSQQVFLQEQSMGWWGHTCSPSRPQALSHQPGPDITGTMRKSKQHQIHKKAIYRIHGGREHKPVPFPPWQ